MKLRLIGTDAAGWRHIAEIEDERVDIDTTSPSGDSGGAASISMETFLKNYKEVTWKLA